METSDSVQGDIQAYLEDRAKTDELFAKSYAKPNKSIDECCAYIWGEAYKRSASISVLGHNVKGAKISKEEVFGMAVHYYDEDDIKIEKMSASVKSSISVPVLQIQNSDPIKNVAATKKQKSAKREEDPRQMSLF